MNSRFLFLHNNLVFTVDWFKTLNLLWIRASLMIQKKAVHELPQSWRVGEKWRQKISWRLWRRLDQSKQCLKAELPQFWTEKQDAKCHVTVWIYTKEARMLDESFKRTIEGLRNKSCYCTIKIDTKKQKCRNWRAPEGYLQVVGSIVLAVVGAVVGSTLKTKRLNSEK